MYNKRPHGHITVQPSFGGVPKPATKPRRTTTQRPTRTQRKSKRITSKRNKTYKYGATKETRRSLTDDLW